MDTISHPVCSIGSEILSQIYLDKEIKLSKSPILLTLPDIPTPTSTFYTKDFYVSKKDIVKKATFDSAKIRGEKIIKQNSQ